MSLNLTKQDLENWSELNKTVRYNMQKIKEMRDNLAVCAGVNYQREGKTNKPGDPVGDAVANFIIRSEALLNEVNRCFEKMKRIDKEIHKIEDESMRRIIRLRHWDRWGWNRIAKEFDVKKTTLFMRYNNFFDSKTKKVEHFERNVI